MKNIRNIVICGGGTAGWLAAAYLSRVFKNCKITLIDKENSTPVGVGEGTLLNFEPFLNQCGFILHDWFDEVGATYKKGILFKNWKQQGFDIWHPFLINPQIELHNGTLISLHDCYSQCQELDFKSNFTAFNDHIYSNLVDLDYKHGYHVDCGKLVKFLKNKIIKRENFNLILSEIENIRHKNDGIDELILKNGDSVSADLFLDCTGFSRLLNESLSCTVDLADELFCNTAIATHIPYVNQEKEMSPYVISEACDIGWIWSIPVRDRIGSGIVFNRNVTSIDDAADYLCNYWQSRVTKDNLTIINWDPYYDKKMWKENVVNIGLSAGFIEPLESTGLALIMEGIYQLSQRITDLTYNSVDKDIFNLSMTSFFQESVDFVKMHYYQNSRTTDFWQYVNKNFQISNKHRHYLNMLKNMNTTPILDKKTNFFTANNWVVWLIQMDAFVNKLEISKSDMHECLNLWRENQNNSLERSVNHTQAIRSRN